MIGEMRHRITIQENVRIPVPGGGGISSWVDVANVWASAKSISVKNTDQDNQDSFKYGYQFKVRYNNAFIPAADMRVLYEGGLFTVQGVKQEFERQRFWIITAFTNAYPVS